MPRPDLSRVPPFYHNYINMVPDEDLLLAFERQGPELAAFLENIPVEKQDHSYGPGKWTIRQMLQHLIDAERIFIYRSLCFARKDETPLPGFEEDSYAENSKADKRSWSDLLEEFKAVRRSTELLFRSFDEEQLNATGISNNHSNYVLAFGFIIVGHCNHHKRIITERYLQDYTG